MIGFLIWLLALNLVAFMSGLAQSTSNQYCQQRWFAAIEIPLAISLLSIVCAMLPTS